jgi:predicted alpha/beta superfamily hydrolase
MLNNVFIKTSFFALLFLCVITILSCRNTGKKDGEDKLKPLITEFVTDSLSHNKFPEVTINNTESRKLKSQYTGENYEIDVFIPTGYYHDTIHYPIVFVLDAEYNFGCVTYITRRLIKNGDIPNVILVGIAYESDDENYYYKTRMRDCTPCSNINGHNSGGVENFVEFFKKELIPFVKNNYRTRVDNITIVGHSIGGFFCGYTLFNHSEIFKNYIIVSPSFWFSNDVIFEYEKTFAKNHKELNASIFVSTGEDESERMVNTTSRFIELMNQRNYQNLRFKSINPEEEHHRSIFPYAFTKGLQFIFENY